MSTATWVFVILGGVGVFIAVVAMMGWIPLATSDRAKLVGTVLGGITALAGPATGFVSHQLEVLSSETGDVNHISLAGLQGISDRLAKLEQAGSSPSQVVLLVSELEKRLRKLEIAINGPRPASLTGTEPPAAVK